MAIGEYKLARHLGGLMHYARVWVETTTGPRGVTIGESVFAWLKDVYGPNAWEWRHCDEMRDGARAGAAYALEHSASPAPLCHVTVTEIHASVLDTTRADVAFATCFAVWNALGDPGGAHPTLEQEWPPGVVT